MRNAYKSLVGRPEGKRPLRKTRRRWEDNIKIELKYTGYKSVARFIRFRIGTNGWLLWTRK
jgi:hypothetical protein